MEQTLTWNVWYHNFNTRKIEPINVFQHWRFCNDLVKLRKDLKKDPTIDTKERLKKDIMYYFWAKSEYEVRIGPLIPRSEKEFVKIDIYEQLMINFDRFHDYVMQNLKHVKEIK